MGLHNTVLRTSGVGDVFGSGPIECGQPDAIDLQYRLAAVEEIVHKVTRRAEVDDGGLFVRVRHRHGPGSSGKQLRRNSGQKNIVRKSKRRDPDSPFARLADLRLPS